jgi:hypothetical protein
MFIGCRVGVGEGVVVAVRVVVGAVVLVGASVAFRAGVAVRRPVMALGETEADGMKALVAGRLQALAAKTSSAPPYNSSIYVGFIIVFLVFRL